MIDTERLTTTSNKGGVAFTFDLDITCKPSEAQKILRLAEKLKSYEDAEEQGLLFHLPCKVGDTVYRPIPKLYRSISVMTVVKFVIHEDGIYFTTDKDGGLFKTSAIGKTIFITKEKAEAALEKMKGKEYDKS